MRYDNTRLRRISRDWSEIPSHVHGMAAPHLPSVKIAQITNPDGGSTAPVSFRSGSLVGL